MYFIGDMVEPGVHGTHPSLTDLDNGDLKFTTDFRSCYAEVLDNWMGADSKDVLGRKWKPTKIIKTT